jgi:hypothetical protein
VRFHYCNHFQDILRKYERGIPPPDVQANIRSHSCETRGVNILNLAKKRIFKKLILVSIKSLYAVLTMQLVNLKSLIQKLQTELISMPSKIIEILI